MPNYMLRLAFVGRNYHGWQVQPEVPTVQKTVSDALEKILGERVKLTGCCRTDAGVHALDYVANFVSEKATEERKLLKALNSLLPKDIGVREVLEVDRNFNARYSVKGKTYLYRIWNSESRDPFLYPFSWHVPFELDIGVLREALDTLSGKHDFAGFAKIEEEKNTLIELGVNMSVSESLIEIRLSASHFLRYMVRRIVGTCVRVAEGKLSKEDIKRFLEGERSPYTAPPHGLTLERVLL